MQSKWHVLYNTTRWRKRARHQLQGEPLCRCCLAHGLVVVATVADHVVPHAGDVHAFWFGELQSLCAQCHNSTKRREELRAASASTGRLP